VVRVVSFADIVEVVLKASGARAPRVLEELEHALPLDVVRDTALKLKPPVESIARLSDTPPRIAAAANTIVGVLDRIAQASAPQMVVLGPELLTACERLRDELRTVVENPTALLPADALSWLTDVRALAQYLNRDRALELAQEFQNRLVGMVRAEALARVESVLTENPELQQLALRVSDTRRAIEAITVAAKGDPLELMNTLQVELARLLDGLIDLSAWKQLARPHEVRSRRAARQVLAGGNR
jgi:hypothetical protein